MQLIIKNSKKQVILDKEISTCGEGVVWRGIWKDAVHRFKVKGDKHSTSKVKKLAGIDVEKMKSYEDFCNYAVTENRFKQALHEVYGEEEPTKQKTGDFIRWIISDIVKEESDVMVASHIEPRDINKYIGEKSRRWLFKLVDMGE